MTAQHSYILRVIPVNFGSTILIYVTLYLPQATTDKTFFCLFVYLFVFVFPSRCFVPKSWRTGERRSHVKKPADR